LLVGEEDLPHAGRDTRPSVSRFALAPGQPSRPTSLWLVPGLSGRSGSLIGRLHPPPRRL